MRSPAPHPARLAKNGNGAHAIEADEREAEFLYHARRLRARFRRTLAGTTVIGIARALMTLETRGRLDIATLRAELDGRDERELTRLLSGDNRLQLSLRLIRRIGSL
jgi:hypothetical protein